MDPLEVRLWMTPAALLRFATYSSRPARQGTLQLTVRGGMGRITVDVRALEEVARSLGDCVARIDAAARLVHRGSGETLLGAPRLDAAVADFRGQWERGLLRIADAVEIVGRRVRDAAMLYSDVDARVANAMLPTAERR